MIMIVGGAYQGKLKYALDRFKLTEEDIYHCADAGIAIPQGELCYEIDKWILALIQEWHDKQEAAAVDDAVRQFAKANPKAIVICNDISCGVVPIDPVMRAWREAVGRAMVRLNLQAEEVVRIFCGIPTKLK